MKRIFIVAGAIVVVVLVFMIARTFMIPAAQIETAAPPIAVDSNAVAQRLSEAVRFQTISYGDGVKEAEKAKALTDMRLWMEQNYPYFHEAAGPEQFGDSFLFTWVGKNPNLPPVLLMAHLDVVPVVPGTEKDWTHPPFSGAIADGFVWGRGTLDDKGQLVAILEAANRLAMSDFQPERTIMFAFGQDEEVGGGKGNAMIAKALKDRATHFAWVLDEGSSIMKEPYPGTRKDVAFISNAEKGFLTLELTAHGQGGHAARPSRDLALPRLSSAILNVVASPFESDLDDIQREKLSVLAPLVPFGDRFILANLWLTKGLVLLQMEAEPDSAAVLHTTISPTILNAGIKENVIPPTARGMINFRLHPRDTLAAVTAHVKQAVADPKVDVTAREETLSEATKIMPTSNPGYVTIANAIRATYGVPVAPDIMTGATDSRHYLSMADAVLRFRPYHEEVADLARVHGTNERVAVSDLGPAVGFYMRLIQDLK